MARPKTKEELIHMAEGNYKELKEMVAALTEEEFRREFDFSHEEKKKEAHWSRDKNVRDVFIHLYEWHQLALRWIEQNQAGKKVNLLPAPYTFKTIAEMNVNFWKKHQNTPYEKSVGLLEESHNKVMKVIASFTEEELFTKKYFSWTGTTTLGSYLISATSSHYDWAIKKIKAHKRNIKNNSAG